MRIQEFLLTQEVVDEFLRNLLTDGMSPPKKIRPSRISRLDAETFTSASRRSKNWLRGLPCVRCGFEVFLWDFLGVFPVGPEVLFHFIFHIYLLRKARHNQIDIEQLSKTTRLTRTALSYFK